MDEEHKLRQRLKQELRLKRELERELDREAAAEEAAKKVKDTLIGMLVLFGIALSMWVMCHFDEDEVEEQKVVQSTPPASVPEKRTAPVHKPKAVTTSGYSSPKCKSIANTIEGLTSEFRYLSGVLKRSTVATLASDIRACRKLSKLVNRMIKLARKGERICRYEREKEAMDTVYTTMISFQSSLPAGCT